MSAKTVSITPSMIDTSDNLGGTFGKHEVERAASTVIRLCQNFDQWLPFTIASFEKAVLNEEPDYNRTHPQEGVGRLSRKLVESNFLESLPDGHYQVSELFVLRAFARHPSEKTLYPYLFKTT